MGEQAEEMGVDIIPGFACDKFITNDKNQILGVATKEAGVDKEGKQTENYMESMKIYAKLTVLAEGARGSLSEKAIEKYNLRENSDP